MTLYYTPDTSGAEFISNPRMIGVVQDYIYQETGETVEIQDPEIMHGGRILINRRQKELLCKAYEWAINHLRA